MSQSCEPGQEQQGSCGVSRRQQWRSATPPEYVARQSTTDRMLGQTHPSISFWIIHPREDIFMSEQEKKTPRSFRNVVLIWLDAFRHWQTEVTFVWFWLNWAEETLFSGRRNPIRCVIQERAFCRHDVYETGEKKKKKKGMLVSGETVTTEENTSCIKCNAAAKFHVALYFKDLVASIRIILAITAALYCSSSSSVHFRSIFVVLILKCVVIDCTMSGV